LHLSFVSGGMLARLTQMLVGYGMAREIDMDTVSLIYVVMTRQKRDRFG